MSNQVSTTDSTEPTRMDGTAEFSGGKIAGITKTIREKARRLEVPLNTELIVVYEGAIAHRDENGRPYVVDEREMVRYYLDTSEVEVTEKHMERYVVASNNQRQFDLIEMTSMTR